ncbi:MAG TPA: GxxExxY protein [Phycisphaerales bacterium]|nr:GxxExxY protein [Phycisphaerales bacterium]HRQ75617.1 GxxExxY protein [Phycisphaerales bacterium]
MTRAHAGTKPLLHAETKDAVIGAAIAVHRALGPGLLESAYEACLVFELQRQGVACRQQVEASVVYDGYKLDCGYRIDVVVEDKVVVEVKPVDELSPLHEAQLNTYLRLSGLRVGLLINFNVRRLLDGVVRRVL